MRVPAFVFAAQVLAAPAAFAEESLTLWLRNGDPSFKETICLVSRAEDGTITGIVQKALDSFPASVQPIPDPRATAAAFDSVLQRIKDGTLPMVAFDPAAPRREGTGMELRYTADGETGVARIKGLKVPPDVLALFDPLGEGACTRLAHR
ncbi:MAG: hypothetical protein HC844_20495 [Tabrizicola sp.]|nr:hypothetical protein [Tabrizicola sp.]